MVGGRVHLQLETNLVSHFQDAPSFIWSGPFGGNHKLGPPRHLQRTSDFKEMLFGIKCGMLGVRMDSLIMLERSDLISSLDLSPAGLYKGPNEELSGPGVKWWSLAVINRSALITDKATARGVGWLLTRDERWGKTMERIRWPGQLKDMTKRACRPPYS